MGGQEAAPAHRGREQSRGEDAHPVHRLRRASISRTSAPAGRGSHGCRFRSTSSSAPRPTTTSAATASSRRFAYHHGYFDGVEREFRGFGMVEQWDTEEFAALNADQQLSPATNVDAASHVPPVLTRTWFHTGVHFGRDHISDFFAGLLDEQDTRRILPRAGIE